MELSDKLSTVPEFSLTFGQIARRIGTDRVGNNVIKRRKLIFERDAECQAVNGTLLRIFKSVSVFEEAVIFGVSPDTETDTR